MSSGSHCAECQRDIKHGEHEPWCSGGDPGGRPSGALIWERLDELELKIDRLAIALGLPPDWDAEAAEDSRRGQRV